MPARKDTDKQDATAAAADDEQLPGDDGGEAAPPAPPEQPHPNSLEGLRLRVEALEARVL